MKSLFIYFSGTGNTKRVLDVAKNCFISRDYEVSEIDVTKDNPLSLDDFDCLVVFYPIYAFNAPKPIIKFVKKIKKSNKKIPCIIMKQSGEHLFWNNASSIYLTRLLKRRNIIVLNEVHYLMPYSFVFRHSDYMAYKMNNIMEKLVPIDLERFFNNEGIRPKRFFLDSLFAFIFRIQWLGGRLNGHLYKVDYNKCIKCMKCVNNCPSKNIIYKDDKFKFKGNCLMCQRCVMYCPNKAIKCGAFNAWRVDMPYTFREAEFQEEKKPNFCRKSYIEYFAKAEETINNHKNI